ncbi:DNA-binding response regulator [bacterium]|nr:DNA-binding response regulator [Chloroflexi bacterium CFX6]RIL10074.1 MAG: DNA-binding response regulator [bacterium]
MTPVRIVVVDDHEVVRIGLANLLASRDGFVVTGQAGTAEAAIEAVASGRPDIVLMDFRLPGRSGIDACRDIVRQWPATRVIMLMSYADDTLVAEAIEAGASGYLLKRVAAAELLSAIEAVANGGASLDPSVARSVVDRLRHAEQSRVMAGFGDLTRRELQVLALLAEGRTNPEIATALFLSEKTVAHHITAIFEKLGVSNRVEAATYAVLHHIDRLVDGDGGDGEPR